MNSYGLKVKMCESSPKNAVYTYLLNPFIFDVIQGGRLSEDIGHLKLNALLDGLKWKV